MKKVAVFCGSKMGNGDKYKLMAQSVGKVLVKHQWGLVYGGANVGLMTAVADSVLEDGGHVTGVMADVIEKFEVTHEGCTELIRTEGMHERKRTMYEMSDVFVILPGGYGSMDELFEAITWNQLDIHNTPCLIMNLGGYYDALIQQVKLMVKEGFVSEEHASMIRECTSVEQLEETLLQTL